jgi:DnaJ-class molecular chaperone
VGKDEQVTKALQLLGLERSAAWQETRANYHALLKQWHPVFSRGNRDVSHERTKEIIAAYKIMRMAARPSQPVMWK